MATPQSTATDELSAPKSLEQITFRFCSECSNMLYPKEDEDAHKLQFTCRTCQYTEDAQSTCVFRNNLNNSSGETAGVTQDVGSDPTVSDCLPVLCVSCSAIIYCSFCGVAASELSVVPSRGENGSVEESMGMCQFVKHLGFWDELTSAEDDEASAESGNEPMGAWDDGEKTFVCSASDSDLPSLTSEEFCEDGAMLVEL